MPPTATSGVLLADCLDTLVDEPPRAVRPVAADLLAGVIAWF